MTERERGDGNELQFINPRYEGATPGDVARALLRHRPESKDHEGPEANSDQSSI